MPKLTHELKFTLVHNEGKYVGLSPYLTHECVGNVHKERELIRSPRTQFGTAEPMMDN